jgi:hypothetical protein
MAEKPVALSTGIHVSSFKNQHDTAELFSVK